MSYNDGFMQLMWYRARRLGSAILLTVAACFPLYGRGGTALTPDQIIQKAVERGSQASGPGLRAYSYTKVTVSEELDSAGKVKERKEKTYQVSFENGRTKARLVEVNGRAPEQTDLKKQTDNEMTGGQLLGQSKSAPGEQRDNFLTSEIAARFDFKLEGETMLSGRRAYEVSFQPKTPEPPVHHLVDKLLNRMSGTLWIDAQEFELARADLQLRSEVNFLGGVIGTLRKLAYTMTRTRVADGVWVRTSSTGDFEGRKLIDPMRIKTKSHATDFHLLGAS
jgi:hypothetical protein